MLETRMKMNNANKVRRIFGNNWNLLDNYDHHPNGRMWIMWKKCTIEIRMWESSDQFIHYEVLNSEGQRQYWLTLVYAHNQLINIRDIWMNIN